MKFEKGIAKKYIKSIESAFEVIMEKGNQNHRRVLKNILESELTVCVYPVSKVNASGITGVTNPAHTNKLIASGRMGLQEALGECFITMAEETIDNGGQRGCEGTMVHEGQHAFDFARTIESLSDTDVNPLSIFNPTLYELEWAGHIAAAEYMLQVGKDEYLKEGIDLMVLGERNGKYYVNEKGIARRLRESYGLDPATKPGARITEMTGLTAR